MKKDKYDIEQFIALCFQITLALFGLYFHSVIFVIASLLFLGLNLYFSYLNREES